MNPSRDSAAGPSLRLWPGVVLVAIQLALWLVLPRFLDEGAILSVLGGAGLGVLVLLWWLFFSRASWVERVGAVVLMVAGVAAARYVVHPSISNAMMGMMLTFYSIPVLSFALVTWAGATRHMTGARRCWTLAVAILLACATFTLVRTDGITGDAVAQLHWRWTPTAEERLLAEQPVLPAGPVEEVQPTATASRPLPDAPASQAAAPSPSASEVAASRAPSPAPGVLAPEPPDSPATPAEPPAAWPGFRGASRDSVVSDVRIATDWTTTPPQELWRRSIGPGWSSFAVAGDLFYTQEQRGDDELVACYRLTTGEPVWMHRDNARFWESNGGAGPRATPAVQAGRVYAMGATGIVNALDARTGRRLWSRNAATDTGAKLPGWGFAGSPLLVNDVVVVAASGRLIAYDARTGATRWKGPTVGGGGYSSPHLITVQGVDQIVLQRGGGAVAVAPTDGSVLWQHSWEEGTSIVQPALLSNGDLIMVGADAMGGLGLRRLAIAKGASAWTASERWTSRGLKPYFNDFVVHEGHAYGFDGSILSAIGLENGERVWKGGRYGHGQMMLLPAQDLLLVLSEEGDVALVSAAPDKFTQLAKVKAIEGKTWNHPVLVGQVLLVRNGEEMVAFRLPSQTPATE